MTFIDESASRTELEGVIVGDGALYAQFNETRLLNDGYTTDEMRQIVMAWIAAGDECQRPATANETAIAPASQAHAVVLMAANAPTLKRTAITARSPTYRTQNCCGGR